MEGMRCKSEVKNCNWRMKSEFDGWRDRNVEGEGRRRRGQIGEELKREYRVHAWRRIRRVEEGE